MSSPPHSIDATVGVASEATWLHGRGVDLWLGYGLAYLVAVPVLLLLGAGAEDEERLAWVAVLLGVAINTPHYGATLLRVYERRDERRRYVFFTVWVSLALALLFAGGLVDAWLGSLLVTAYASWSPWHFSGQNYGLVLMCLRRSGVATGREITRPLYASFIASAALAILATHTGGSAGLFAEPAVDETGTFEILQLGIPPEWGWPVVAAVAGFYALCLATFCLRLAPRVAGSLWLPVASLLGAQALWFSVPAVAAFSGMPLRALLPFASIVISLAHSTQYLWVTSYYARRDAPEGGHIGLGAFYTKALLAGAAISAPILALAPGLLGPVAPNAGGVLVLGFAVVNLHHFVLDGAIWKLRDGRVAQVLLRAERGAAERAEAAPRRRWLRASVWLLGLAVVGTNVDAAWLTAQARVDQQLPTLQRAAERLAFYGLDRARLWDVLGARYEQVGDADAAIDAYRRSIARKSDPPLVVANRLAWLLIEREPREPDDLAQAQLLARYLLGNAGDKRSEALETVAAVHAAGGAPQRALGAARASLREARQRGDRARVQYLRGVVADYAARAEAARAPASGAPADGPDEAAATTRPAAGGRQP